MQKTIVQSSKNEKEKKAKENWVECCNNIMIRYLQHSLQNAEVGVVDEN